MKSHLRSAFLILLWGLPGVTLLSAQTSSSYLPLSSDQLWSHRIAAADMARWPEGHIGGANSTADWNQGLGTLLLGVDDLWLNTADPRYFNYIKSSMDRFVGPDGVLSIPAPEENRIEDVLLGRQLLLLYGVTQDARYAKAATQLYDRLKSQPRTDSGGFWHNRKSPHQMWLEDAFMAEPFYAEYAAVFHHPEGFGDVSHQFALLDERARDPKSGLFVQGWDESSQERWSDGKTGRSTEAWARATGWHMMALVDTISSFPADDPGREPLLAQLERDAATVTRLQDASSGLWFDVLDKGRERGNYLESSASAMFIYTLARGVRLGYLPAHYAANADRAYRGFVSRFLQPEGATSVLVSGSTEAVGLGGQPYGDGSFESYVAAKVAADDPVAEGVFLLASSEMEDLPLAHLGRGRTVLLDAWFNSQTRQDAFGTPVSYHYKWDDRSDSGFSTLGHIFNNFGIDTRTLVSVPFVETLRHAQIYIIASPDSLAANPQANTIRSEDVSEIVQWVKEGGVLVIMANNSTSADLTHLNLLSERFGIRFNDVLRSHVDDSKWEMGKIIIAGSGPLFRYPHSLFMKDTCTLSVRSPAGALLSDHGNGLMAQAKFGRGMVLATVSPWLTNEFTDGRKLPREYDNYAAGQEMVRWLLGQIP